MQKQLFNSCVLFKDAYSHGVYLLKLNEVDFQKDLTLEPGYEERKALNPGIFLNS